MHTLYTNKQNQPITRLVSTTLLPTLWQITMRLPICPQINKQQIEVFT